METRKLLSLAVYLAATLGISGCGPAASPGAPAAASTQPSPTTAAVAPAPTATFRATPTAVPDVRPTPTMGTKAQATPAAALTVEEYPVVSKDMDTPTHFEYKRRIDPMVLEKRKQWREPAPQEQMARANEALNSFGYKLSSTEQPGCPTCVSFRLHRQGNLVVSDIVHFRPPVLSENGSDFAMLLEVRQGKSFVVQKDGISPWMPGEHAYIDPTMLGNDLLTVDQPQPEKCEVRKGKEVLYSFAPPQQRVDNPLKGLWAWQGRWALEVEGTVLIDGKSLNREKGYDEVFDLRLIKGEPFYFFRKGGEIGVSYAGQVLPYRYHEVIHYRCCEPAAFNVQGNDDMVWFHALRGGTNYYVEMGHYEGAAGSKEQPRTGQLPKAEPQVWMGVTIQGERPDESRRLVPGQLASVPLPQDPKAGYEIELAFPKDYDLSRIAVMVDSRSWAFATNSGAVKPSGTHVAYLFGLQPKGTREPGAVRIEVNGVRGPEGTAPVVFSFWAGGR